MILLFLNIIYLYINTYLTHIFVYL
jgi:hypothetical protein